MNSTHVDQIKRAIRSYNKLPNGKVIKRIDPRTIDNYYHFFQDCYHLKDWIINDPTISVSKQDVENYINGSKYLKIVGGIANATKHLKLLNEPRQGVGKNIDVSELEIGEDKGLIVVYGSGESIFAHSLAIFAMQEWQVFLLNYNLPSLSMDRRLEDLLC